MSASPTFDLTCELIRRQSVTPKDEGCMDLMMQHLAPLGFKEERLNFGDTENLWAVLGDEGPLFVFAGHTDVVPTGPESDWDSPPFDPQVRDGYLYGRGTADMKASLAAMVTACQAAFADKPELKARVAFLITSDEEGPAHHGTVKVVEHLTSIGEQITWCLVGEPSSTNKLGDIIKNGRRGSLGCKLTVKGKQGHVAYPHLAKNPVHIAAPALAELSQEEWDQGNDFFPATSFQISNINAGTGATNVIPGTCEVIFNFRFSTELTEQDLRSRTEAILDKHGLEYDIDWQLSGQPFLTDSGLLVEATQASIAAETGYETELSTSGGTSDGRFIAPTGAQVVELGPCNATIHQLNECVKVADLEPLSRIYQGILERLVCA